MINNNNSAKNLYDNFEKNFSELDYTFSDCPDIIRRRVAFDSGAKGCFFYVQGLCDANLMQRDVIMPILKLEKIDTNELKYISSKIPVGQLTFPVKFDALIKDILSGNVVFICDGLNCAISFALRKYEKRVIDEPKGEKNIRGNHDGFIEDLETNMAILRRKIKNPNLKFKNFTIGAASNQTVSIAYLDNVANPNLLKTLCDKISNVDYDCFIGIGYLEQLMIDHPKSIFPQYLSTERPDKAVAGLLEGRFVLMLQETSFVLILPVTFFSFIQTTDDHTVNWIGGTYLVMLRLMAIFVTLFVPSTYIAILTFHYYMIPLSLLVPIAQSRAKVPFPPVVEAFLIEFIIEMIREASIRLPTFITSSISIVGGLVIGQAAVQAGIVSDLMIITIGAAAIAGFTIPTYDMGISFRLFKYFTMITSSIFGVIGVVVPAMLLLSHLLVLDSLGEPYFQPIEPFKFRDLKDTLIRAPLKYLKKRPDIAKPLDKERGNGNG
ncbi:MAG: spore germination protein [Bacillota bacterium]|nr:spore germination protein [Bacillota bacterium]